MDGDLGGVFVAGVDFFDFLLSLHLYTRGGKTLGGGGGRSQKLPKDRRGMGNRETETERPQSV